MVQHVDTRGRLVHHASIVDTPTDVIMTEDSSADRLLQQGAYIPGTASLVAEVDSMLCDNAI